MDLKTVLHDLALSIPTAESIEKVICDQPELIKMAFHKNDDSLIRESVSGSFLPNETRVTSY